MESKKKKLEVFTYIYSHPFEKVKNLLRDLSITHKLNNQVIENYTTDFKQEKLSNTWEVGAIFSMTWKKIITMIFHVEQYEETEMNMKVSYRIKTIPPTPEYNLIYNLYKNSASDLTTFVMEWYYEVEIDMRDTDETKNERLCIYSNFDKYLTELESGIIQEEKIYLRSNLMRVWTFIKDFKKMRGFIPQLCESVEYEGNLQKDTNLVFTWKTGKGLNIAYTNVTDIIENDNYCELLLNCTQGSPPVPRQQIKWSVEKCQDEMSLIKFAHIYKDHVKESSIKIISRLKKDILESLRNILELEEMLMEI